MNDYTIREAETGDASLVSYFYFKLFEKQFQFLPNVEQYFLHAAAEIFDDPEGSRLWVLEVNGTIEGSICVVKKSETEAQLRLFGMEPGLQGKGAGKALMQAAMAFCEEKHYNHIHLWTIDICKAARHLYAKFGFHLTDIKPNTTWAEYPMTEELWVADMKKEEVNIIPAYDRVDEFKALVVEYTDDILKQGEDVKECLKNQHLAQELEGIEKKYAMPMGRMYLALLDEEVVGCLALVPNDDGYCEMKRLYVLPSCRGKHISQSLVEQVIDDAKAIGYKAIRLDTFPFMANAIHLYEKYGFRFVERYNDNPAPSAIFMQLDL